MKMSLFNTFRLFALSLTIVLSIIDTPADTFSISRPDDFSEAVEDLGQEESFRLEVRDDFRRPNDIGVTKDDRFLPATDTEVKDYVSSISLSTLDGETSENSFDTLKSILFTTADSAAAETTQFDATDFNNSDNETRTEKNFVTTPPNVTNQSKSIPAWKKYTTIKRKPTVNLQNDKKISENRSEEMITDETGHPVQDTKTGDIPSLNQIKNFLNFFKSDAQNDTAASKEATDIGSTVESNVTPGTTDKEAPATVESKRGGFLDFSLKSLFEDNDDKKDNSQELNTQRPKTRKLSWRIGSRYRAKEDSSAEKQGKTRFRFRNDDDKNTKKDKNDSKNIQESQEDTNKNNKNTGSKEEDKDRSQERNRNRNNNDRNKDSNKQERNENRNNKKTQEEDNENKNMKEKDSQSKERYQSRSQNDKENSREDNNNRRKDKSKLAIIKESDEDKARVVNIWKIDSKEDDKSRTRVGNERDKSKEKDNDRKKENKSSENFLNERDELKSRLRLANENDRSKETNSDRQNNRDRNREEKGRARDNDKQNEKSQNNRGDRNRDNISSEKNVYEKDQAKSRINSRNENERDNYRRNEKSENNRDRNRDNKSSENFKNDRDDAKSRSKSRNENERSREKESDRRNEKTEDRRGDRNRENKSSERVLNEKDDARSRSRSRNENETLIDRDTDKRKETSENNRRDRNRDNKSSEKNTNEKDEMRSRSRNENEMIKVSDNNRKNEKSENNRGDRNRGNKSSERLINENNENRSRSRQRTENETSKERNSDRRDEKLSNNQENKNRENVREEVRSRSRSRNDNDRSNERDTNRRNEKSENNRDDKNRNNKSSERIINGEEDIRSQSRSRNGENKSSNNRGKVTFKDRENERISSQSRNDNERENDNRNTEQFQNNNKLFGYSTNGPYENTEDVTIRIDDDPEYKTPSPPLMQEDLAERNKPKLDEYTKLFLSTIEEEDETETQSPTVPQNEQSTKKTKPTVPQNIVAVKYPSDFKVNDMETTRGNLEPIEPNKLTTISIPSSKDEEKIKTNFHLRLSGHENLQPNSKPTTELSRNDDSNRITFKSDKIEDRQTTIAYDDYANVPSNGKQTGTMIQMNEDAIKEELLKEEVINNYEENKGRYKGDSFETTTMPPTTIPVKIYEVNKPLNVKELIDERLSVKPLNILEKLKTTILYPVSPNYKPPKKIDVQPPKTFVRDPDDNSWRNESLSSLGIVFNPKNSSKPFTQVLKNKTETEWNNLLEKSNKNETPDLRVRLEKIAEMRKTKKKKTDAFGNVFYNDYEDAGSKENVLSNENYSTTSPEPFTKSTTILTTEMTTPKPTTTKITQPTITTSTSTTTTTTPKTNIGTTMIQTKGTTEKPKKIFNVAEYYDTSDEDDADYLNLAKMDLKKFTPPLHNTHEVHTPPTWPVTNNRYVHTKPDDRQPTVQYFPPLTTKKTVTYNKGYDHDFNNKMNSYTETVPPTNVLPVSYTKNTTPLPVTRKQHVYRPTLKSSLGNAFTTKPIEYEKNIYVTPAPGITEDKDAYTFVTDDGSFNKASDVIKHYRDFLNAVAKDHEEDKNLEYIQYTKIPPQGVTLSEAIPDQGYIKPKPEPPENYDYDTDYKKDLLQRFVHNFNDNSQRFKSNLPMLYNNSIIHSELHGENGNDVALSRAYLSRFLARPNPDCDHNATVELSPAYELHYYVPEQEEKEEIDPKPVTLPYQYRL